MDRPVSLVRTAGLALLALVAVGAPVSYGDVWFPVNEAGRIHAAMALVDHGSPDLDAVWDEVYPGWRERGERPNEDAAFLDGHFRLDKPPGVTLLAVPIVAVDRALGLELSFARLAWLLALVASAIPTVLALLALRAFLRRELGRGPAVRWIGAATVLATPWLLFGAQALAHALAASLVALGTMRALGGLRSGHGAARPGRDGILGGLALGGAVLAEASAALVVLAVLLGLALDRARRRRLPAVLLGGIGPAAILLAWNAFTFGDPFTYGYAHKATASMAEAHARGVLGLSWPDPGALAGLLLSPRRGLLFLAPWLGLAFAGAVCGLRDGRVTPAWRVVLAAGVLGVPVLLSGFSDWHGGSTVGPRYLVFALPLFGVAAALGARRLDGARGRPVFRAALLGLVISSFGVLLLPHLGMPVVHRSVANPVAEVVAPILFAEGPLGTILDPLLGPVAAAAAVAAAGLLVLLGALDPRTGRRRGAPVGRLAVAVALATMAAHALAVALPRSEGLEGRVAVLGARAHTLRYMGREREAERLDLRILRLRIRAGSGD